MIEAPVQWGPWLALATLGVFHGINPAMGWLFAVALGIHRGERRIVFLSLVPIAAGHAAAVAVAVLAFLSLGLVMDYAVLTRMAAAVLIGWAIWHAIRSHRRPVRIGMQTGLAGLAAWSFVMASAHGAGLMVIPVVAPMCLSGSPPAGGPMMLALAALAVHTVAMLSAIAAVSVLVYNWIGVAFLRRGWINIDVIWAGALVVCGILLVLG